MDTLAESRETITSLFAVNMLVVPSENCQQYFNGLSRPLLSDVLGQFSSIKGLQATFRDPATNTVNSIDRLRFKFNNFNQLENAIEPAEPARIKRTLFEAVSTYSSRTEYLSKDCFDTPWFEDWKHKFLSTLEVQEHEFVGSNFGAVFVFTLEELEQFSDLIAGLQQRVKNVNSIRWFSPNYLKYFLVINRNPAAQANPQDSPGYRKYQEIAAMYSGQCGWLDFQESDATALPPSIKEPLTTAAMAQNGDSDRLPTESGDVSAGLYNKSDPLSPDDGGLLTRFESVAGTPPPTSGKTPPAFEVVHFSFSMQLLAAVEGLVKDFISKALIPWSERQLRLLNDAISQRRGFRRNIFSATKQLLAMSSSVNLKGQAVGPVYQPESNEMQQRKVADLCMCLQLVELAHSNYNAAKKEFQADGASIYYAGAAEAHGMASLLLNRFQRSYFDEAITAYLDVCRNTDLATRATLIATEALISISPNDAANLFIRMTSEDSDLRSALFLEQAAKCFLKSPVPRTRKSAFHYVLAGYRFNKCGLKRHALACYSKFQFEHWTHAIDHVHLTVHRLESQLLQGAVDLSSGGNGSTNFPNETGNSGQPQPTSLN